jgi:DNA-binding response OmpR family regulator
LIISGVIEVEGKEKTMKMGTDDYLPKPFDNKELKMEIKKTVKCE